MARLRRLSVFVDEPEPGRFYWVLHESTGDPTVWVDGESSAQPFPTWTAALEAGTVALYRLVPDELAGPRAAGEDEDASPVG